MKPFVIYARKSTESEDRQVLSIDSQINELQAIAARLGHGEVHVYKESMSAKAPGRPVFNKLMEMVESGKIAGILCWKLDRLARNPMDAAQIIYLLDTGKLKDLKFCSYYFDNSPEGKMMLQITLSQSKYSSDKLSKDVSRGLNKKASAGHRPCLATIGYLNSKIKLKGEQDISIDPERFNLVKQLWDKMLMGNHSVPDIVEYANEIGLTQPATRKLPERPIRAGMLYKMFSNPFYYGFFEWPEGSNNLLTGAHQPMITEEEFDRVQQILGRKGRQRPKKQRFAFTGLIRCICGMVTAEESTQKNGNIHHYIHYHCGHKIKPDCTENRSVQRSWKTNRQRIEKSRSRSLAMGNQIPP